MIIRNQVIKTLKASPLNSRGSARPTEYANVGNIDPEWVARAHGRPSHRRGWGDPVGVDVTRIYLSGGASHTPAIERRRLQRLMHATADKYENMSLRLCETALKLVAQNVK